MAALEETAAHWREWFDRGDFEDGAARVNEALAAESTRSVARVRTLYGAHLFAFLLGKPSAAYCDETLAGEGVRKAREAGDQAAEGAPLHLEAAGVRLAGDYDHARDLYLESVAWAGEAGDERRKQTEFHNLGWVELHRGDVDAAERMFAERDARSGLDALGDAWTQLNQAALALARDDRDEGARLYDEGKRRLDELGATLDPDDQFEFDWLSDQLKEG